MRRPGSQPPELPGFTFVRLLGSGGFSDVFLYDQHLPKRRVAVKVLLTEEITGANRTAFTAEANLMAQLSAHPYIASIYHAGVAGDDRPYFVMEYCSGPSLAERYKSAPFEVADALRTGVRLSSAVATAHSAGILHRDIKPANVLTNDYGWPALTDFGISSALDDEPLVVHTGTLDAALADGSAGGTAGASIGMSVPWSPPEVFGDDPHPDIRSDVFSLAATVYTVLAGRTPFEVTGRSNGTLDLIGRIERGAISVIDRTDIPRSLTAVLHKGMAPDRADRFATAIDFARALQRVELELGYSPTPIDVPNLDTRAPDRAVAGDDGDATRVRGVATVDAQPAAAPPPRGPRAPAAHVAPPPAAETVVRGAVRVDAQPVAVVSENTVVRAPVAVAEPAGTSPVVAEPPAEHTTGSRRGRVVVAVAGLAAGLVALAVVAGILLLGPASAPEPSASPRATGEAAVVDGVPAPVLASAVPEAGTLVFTAVNPEPEDGDSFVWRRTDRTASEPRSSSADGRIVVESYTVGQTVCIEVSIVRAGRQSANPLETCHPQ